MSAPLSPPLFPLGQVELSPGAREAVPHARLMEVLASHASGDWGCIDDETAAESDDAVHAGLLIVSAHPIDPALWCTTYGENCLVVVTERDRSKTTVVLPEEW